MTLNITKTKNFIISLYFFIMSILIISISIYYRLIFKRNTYSLELIKTHVTLEYFLLLLLFTCLHLFILCMYIYKRNHKSENSVILSSVNFILNTLLWKPLDYLLSLIAPHIPYSGTIILQYTYFFRQTEFRLVLLKVLCFILYFLPKMIMSIIFFYEIFFLHRSEVFIKLIWIFLIPVLFLIFLNLSEQFFKNNITAVEKVLHVIPRGLPNKNGIHTAHEFKIKKGSGYGKESLKELSECWGVLFYITNLNSITRLFISQTNFYVTLMTSTLYFITFIYQIYYLFLI